MDIQEVTITKTVPVIDRESLEAWLNEQLVNYMGDINPHNMPTIGSVALNLIEQAGFKITPPSRTR